MHATRAQECQAKGRAILLPHVEVGGHLIDYLWEAGPSRQSSMGSVALDWVDIRAWQQCTGACLSSWEAKTLRGLSRVFVAQAGVSADPKAPPPWQAEMSLEEKKAVAERVKSMFRGGGIHDL